MKSTSMSFYATSLVISALTLAIANCDQSSEISAEEARENLKKLATANNDFAFNLHRRLVTGEPESNVFFSPFSLSVAFAMLYYGARGDTAQELRRTFGYDAAELSDDLLHATFKEYLDEILTSNISKGYTLRSANALLVDRSLNLNPEYKTGVEAAYQARIRDVNFGKDANKIKDRLNKWVKTKTKGMIDSIVQDVSPNTRLMILNAVYFKGFWKIPFNPEFTREEVFYNNGQESQATPVDSMFMEGRFQMTSALDSAVLELPYKGDNISMLIILPNERDGLPALESRMTVEQLSTIRENLRPSIVQHVQIPKFKLEFSKSLVDDLSSMDMNSVFGPGADFSGMVGQGGFAVSEVIHKAAIETNEEGSTAAAVTAIAVPRSGIRGYFTADHPFLFAIVNRRNDLVLFLGRVNNL